LGPTASGKTSLAIDLHKSLPIEIISVDSVMVYKGCDIGSAKPTKDILLKHPHHLIDCVDPESIFTVADFHKKSIELIDKIHQKNKVPFFVGGSMMYFNSLLKGLDSLPKRDEAYRLELEKLKKNEGIESLYSTLLQKDALYAAKVKSRDTQRIIRALEVIKVTGETFTSQTGNIKTNIFNDKFNLHQYAIYEEDRTKLHNNIEDRLRIIIDNGLLNEVSDLLSNYKISLDHPIRKAVNYKQAISFINNDYDQEEFFTKSLYATRQLAKRQTTWLRSWKDINLFSLNSKDKIKDKIKSLISSL
jgi:tRNA dimethylallyltransferase